MEYIKKIFINNILSPDLIIKYKSLIGNYLECIDSVITTFVQNKSSIIDIHIIELLEITQYLYTSIDFCEDYTQDHFIKKLENIMLIIKNIIIIMTYWRKSSNTFIDIFKSNISLYEKLINTVLNSCISDIEQNNQSNYCEPRVLSIRLGDDKKSGLLNRSENGYRENDILTSPGRSRNRCNDIVSSPSRDRDIVSHHSRSRGNSSSYTPSSSDKKRSNDTYDDRSSDYALYGDETHVVNNITGERKQITYDEITALIAQSYGNNPDMECSTSLDIIALYLQGQKLLYIEAKNYSEQYLNSLMLPAITISVIVGLVALIFTSRLGFIIVACLSALNSLLLSLISYLKLDAKSEAHKTSAYHFDKLETECSFLSGKILFFDAETENIIDVVINIEKRIREIKEINQFVLPDYVRDRYPHTYGTNIFSVVKRLYIDETTLKNELKNTINMIIVKSRIKNKSMTLIEEIKKLEITQDKLLNNIIQFKKKYLELDKPLKYEIEKNIRIKKMHYCGCGILNKLTCGIVNKFILFGGPHRPQDYSVHGNEYTSNEYMV